MYTRALVVLLVFVVGCPPVEGSKLPLDTAALPSDTAALPSDTAVPDTGLEEGLEIPDLDHPLSIASQEDAEAALVYGMNFSAWWPTSAFFVAGWGEQYVASGGGDPACAPVEEVGETLLQGPCDDGTNRWSGWLRVADTDKGWTVEGEDFEAYTETLGQIAFDGVLTQETSAEAQHVIVDAHMDLDDDEEYATGSFYQQLDWSEDSQGSHMTALVDVTDGSVGSGQAWFNLEFNAVDGCDGVWAGTFTAVGTSQVEHHYRVLDDCSKCEVLVIDGVEVSSSC